MNICIYSHIYTYILITSLYNRNELNLVNQLFFNFFKVVRTRSIGQVSIMKMAILFGREEALLTATEKAWLSPSFPASFPSPVASGLWCQVALMLPRVLLGDIKVTPVNSKKITFIACHPSQICSVAKIGRWLFMTPFVL